MQIAFIFQQQRDKQPNFKWGNDTSYKTRESMPFTSPELHNRTNHIGRGMDEPAQKL